MPVRRGGDDRSDRNLGQGRPLCKSMVVWAICEGREAWGNYEAISDYLGDGAVSVVRE